MNVDKTRTRITQTDSTGPEERVNMSKSEAISFMWELSAEVFSLSGKYDVESRLQRHVVSLTRK